MKTAILFFLFTSIANAAPNSGCDFAAAGIEDKETFLVFFADLKAAAKAQDAKALGKMALYPLKVNSMPKQAPVESAAELEKRSKAVFTKKVLDAIASQEVKKLFCRDQGVMIGDGEAWIQERNGKIGIAAINQ